MLPQLGEVERRFPNELVVIGVHSAKFPGERPGGSLQSAIQRYEIEHPVINDDKMEVWNSYSVRAWPTLMFLDPEGRVIGKHEGEAHAADLADVVERLVRQYDELGLIDRSAIPGIARMERPDNTLAFPAKVIVDSSQNRLYIADSGHNRIIVTERDGANPWIIGSGQVGLVDDDIASARFHHPHGLALDGDSLFVADTRNHVLRRVDLTERTVETIAGTGQAGLGYADAGDARSIDLRSPWDVFAYQDVLYIAMAGMHQLWALDLDEGYLRPYAGTGWESIQDGELAASMLAQPSALDSDGVRLFFADSETSAIRTADLPPGTAVRTLVGTGLFDFGDVDGAGDQVRLQHPLGVAVGDGVVYVADSYNHKIKRLYPDERRVESWLGSGEPGVDDGTGAAARFNEPSGLWLAGQRLYIADTNNHAIRVADTETGEVTTLQLPALTPAGRIGDDR